MPYDVVRDAAIDVLLRVFEGGAYLNVALDKTLRRKELSERGRRFLTQLVYGTVRHKLLCDHVLRRFANQPLEELPRPIHAILRMGVFQALFCTQVTFPAMVHTGVDLAKHRGHAGTARLVNAVLRRVPERLEEVRLPAREKDVARYLSIRYSMPLWIVEEWIEEYGEGPAEALCETCNRQASAMLRVNTLQTSADRLLAALSRAGCSAEKRTAVPEEITVLQGEPPARSKLFEEGDFLVQDAASMLPSHLLEPQEGEMVLDLCAAPGGKATHLAQLMRDQGQVIAMDVHAAKLRLVRENAARLGMQSVHVLCGDGRAAPVRAGADRVLVDAPCTGLGTLRRHPDLKWRVTPEDRTELAALQTALLRSGIALCKNGGLIVYSVCTFTRQETQEVVRATLAAGEVQLEDGPDWFNPWKIDKGQYRILPSPEGLDGFFLTRLRKAS